MSKHTQFYLLGTRRFLPLFCTQFLGAFNDNVLKNALVILITYVIAERTGQNAQIMVTVAAGIFILPFFLFSSIAGQLADKYEKSKLTRIIKLVEVFIMMGAVAGFYLEDAYILLAALFLSGVQSTFFGPIKYSILPDHLHKDELIGGNALIEAGTFLSILLGTIIGGVMVLAENGTLTVSAIIMLSAIIGLVSSFFMPKALPPAPNMRLNLNLITETWRIIQYSRGSRDVFLSILGISWFWLIGATFLSQFPTYAKNVLGGNEHVVTLFLTVFSVGIGIGSLFCNRLLKGRVEATYVPAAALGITFFTLDLVYASGQLKPVAGAALGLAAFLASPEYWRILFDLLMISACGGIYIVPLYAIMQTRSDKDHRSRTIASNNVMNALFMVVAAIATVVMFAFHFTVIDVFLFTGIINGLMALYICKLLPHAVLRTFVRWLLKALYGVRATGTENYKDAGDRVLIIANHTSFLDAALIAAYSPDRLTFAINTHVAKKWWIKPFLVLVDAFPLDPTNPMAIKSLIEAVKQGKKVVIFPEGRITVTGSLMKIYEGPGMIADKAGATLLPVRIDGAQYSPLSRLRGKVRIQKFPRIKLTFLPSRTFVVPAELRGKKRRHAAGTQLYDLMTEMMFESSDCNRTFFQALLDARAIHGGNHTVIEDVERKPLTYTQLIRRSLVLSSIIKRHTKKAEYVGVLMPNMNSTVVLFAALHAAQRIPAMLNFSTGAHAVAAACITAQIKNVYTSRRFVELGKLEALIAALEKENVTVRYLEDVRKQVNVIDKLYGLANTHTSRIRLPRNAAEKPAVILFTSGSEGSPKGVVLSHKNLLSNYQQLAARVDFGPTDVVFNALPIFHSFGLTGGTLLPLLSGIKTFFYPSPLHYRIVPELVYDTNATVMFGTDTFLSGYARFAHPYDFYSIRYVFAGAEKLKEETRKVWSEKFGVRIFEGYGATETSPVIATNTPMQNKSGTVGRFMPGVKRRLEPVPGVEDGKRLFVQGPNIMLGYLLSTSPGTIVPPADGWYDTGDIVDVDEQGYITIKGRAKRFAKVGGEMVSLTAVESYIASLWPQKQHAVMALPDAKKGEQLALLTTQAGAKRQDILAHFKKQGIAELSIPKHVLPVASIPLLGTGKVDYVKAKKIAEDLVK